ncbi:hypothetical protein SGLAM104S_06445 [Streptomyces glaucescens]
MRRLRVLLRRTPEAHRAAQQPDELDARAARHDQLRGVRAQIDLDLDPLAGLRVGLGALGGLHGVRVRVDVRQHDVRQLRQEREPQIAVAGLRDDEQPGRVPVGADQRAQRRPGLTGGDQRHEDQRPFRQVPVPHGRGGLRAPAVDGLQPREGGDQRHGAASWAGVPALSWTGVPEPS